MKKITDLFNKDKRIEKYLNKNGFTKVPTSWPKEMQSIGDKYDNAIQTLRVIGQEYNELLKDYAQKLTGAELKKILESIDVQDLPKGKDKLELVYIDTFKINFEDDKEEKVKPEKKKESAKNKPESKKK